MKTKTFDLLACVQDIADLGKEAINFFNQGLPAEIQRPGCYLNIVDKKTGETILMIRVLSQGSFIEEKANKYFNLAISKAKSIFLYQQSAGYYTSRETSLEEDGYPPGAILYGDHIVSISGQTADDDEALAILISVGFLPLNEKIGFLKGKVKGNKRIKQLLKHFLWRREEFPNLARKIDFYLNALTHLQK